uniref:pyridoxal phosphate-dependent aminotransferase n=1 Tax=Candidatus Ruminimicrobium bovinum TaxID=3242779 RepID=UPI0039B8FB7D
AIKPSPTWALDTKAKELQAQGINIISFGTGEPDFDTPLNIKQAAIEAINAGFTKYCPVAGTLELKKAIIKKFKEDNNLDYQPNEIIVSCGAKHSLYNIFQAILNEGDEIIIPSPYWVSYPDMALLAGAQPVFVKATDKNNFKVSPKSIENVITPKTKAIVINSPSNPTGATWTLKELEEIAEVCLRHNLLIISDEIYEKLVYDNFKYVSIAQISKEIKERTLVVNGVSKAFAMTGWRIGYCAGNKDIIAAMTKIQSQSTSNPTSISIKATVEALNGPKEAMKNMVEEFKKRRDYIVKRLNAIEGINCLTPNGAFYVFPNVSKLLGKKYNGVTVKTDSDLSNYLLDKARVAVVAGSSFGAPGYIRLSYATSMEKIEKGLDAIEEQLKV